MADVLGGLKCPGDADVPFELTVQHFTWLATGIVVSQLGLLVSSAVVSHSWNNFMWGYVLYLPSYLMMLLVCAATLDRRCSLWLLRASVVTASATLIQGHFFTASNNFRGVQIFVLLFGISMSLVCIKTLQVCRLCLQMQYPTGDKMLEASRKVFLHILGTSPVLLVFALNSAIALSQLVGANEEYAAHTPLCRYTPYDRGLYNTEYSCTEDPGPGGNHIFGHTALGIPLLPLLPPELHGSCCSRGSSAGTATHNVRDGGSHASRLAAPVGRAGT